MRSHFRHFTACITWSLTLVLLMLMGGCQIDEPKLKKWGEQRDTQAKLAQYGIEVERPIELRRIALKEIALKRRYNLMLSMFEALAQHEENKEAKLTELATEFVQIVEDSLKVEPITPEEETQAAELTYYLIYVNSARPVFAERLELLKRLTTWSLSYLRSGDRKIVPVVQGENSLVDPAKLLSALLYTAESKDEATLDELTQLIEADMNAHLDQVDYALRLHKVIQPLQNKLLSTRFATLFVKVIKLAYRDQPKVLTEDVFNAMRENGNLTLIKLLIELARDEEGVADAQILSQSIRQALDQSRHSPALKELREGILRIISSERAASTLIFDGLYWAWSIGDHTDLKSLLMSLPVNFKSPVLSNELRERVNQVCADISDGDRDVIYTQLEESLDLLKKQKEQWLARLITVACLDQLYPDGDTVKTLLKKHRATQDYVKDKRMILAWEPDREVPFGEIVNRYITE